MKPGVKLSPTAFLPFLRLVGRFPLHLAAAFLAALLAELLFTVQPAFLRAFIDQAQAGAPRGRLLVFPAFMAGAAVLAYAFDFISVTIRYLLEARLSRLLKEVFVEFGAKDRPEVLQFSLWTGLSRLSRLALSLSVDLWLAMARIALVLAFLSLEHWGFGLAAGAAMLLGGAVNWRTTRKIGRLSKSKEIASGKFVAGAQAGGPARAKRRLSRLYAFDFSEFGLRSANFAASFLLFRILPLGVVAWYVWVPGLSLGSVTSAFLYFSMLQGPYGDLARLIQDAMVAASESELFREDLERGLTDHQALAAAGCGLIWKQSGEALGSPLSRAKEDCEARLFFDDSSATAGPGTAARKAVLLDTLRRRALAGEALLLRTPDPLAWQFAHFRLRDGLLRTVLSDLGPEGVKPFLKNGVFT